MACGRRSCGVRSRGSCPARRSTTCCAPRSSCAAQGLDAVFTRLGENVSDLDEAQAVAGSLSRGGLTDSVAGHRLRAVDQADPARSRHRSRQGHRARAHDRRARARRRQLPMDRHGAVAVRRRHARDHRNAPAGISGRRRLPAGVLCGAPTPISSGCGAAAPACAWSKARIASPTPWPFLKGATWTQAISRWQKR